MTLSNIYLEKSDGHDPFKSYEALKFSLCKNYSTIARLSSCGHTGLWRALRARLSRGSIKKDKLVDYLK